MRRLVVLLSLAFASSASAVPVHAVSAQSEAEKGCRSGAERFCDGYLLATFDQMSLYGEICPGVSLTSGQARALVRQYLREHPDARSFSFAGAAIETFRSAFPCRDQRATSN